MLNWSEVELFDVFFKSNSVSASTEHNGEQKTKFSCQDFNSGTLEELLETYTKRIDRDLQTSKL